MEVQEQIRKKGLEAGFDAVGFATAGPVDAEHAQHFRNWIAQGRHAGMNYMARCAETRLDPRHLLPEARTVVVVQSNYYREIPPPSVNSGKIARYAMGRDYHKVMEKGLKNLSRWMNEAFPGTKTLIKVDTGTILERYWAQQAGLGWIGKNTLLINQQFGSWTFLGILLTSLEVPPDSPQPNHCGSCTRCLEACPTQALLAPGIHDSNRCLSFWTIENRTDSLYWMEESLNGWIFGCDECQLVCPWNRHAQETTHPEFATPNPIHNLSLKSLAKISWEEWDQKTRGTALRRAGYEGLIRNCQAVLYTQAVENRRKPGPLLVVRRGLGQRIMTSLHDKIPPSPDQDDD